MKFVEYKNADPLSVLHLNLLSLGYPLTPELAARILRLDPRAFPFLGVYAVDDGIVAGQVLVYRLPATTLEGPEDVGGVAAVCTHPAFSHRGVASQLLDEAHQRMRAAGLRFSTLATTRHRLAYLLYQRLGYVDLFSFGSAFAPVRSVRTKSELRAECTTPGRLTAADALFRRLSVGRLGFARRHDPFFPAIVQLGDLDTKDLWLLTKGDASVGYAVAKVSNAILNVSDLLLENDTPPATAVGAIGGAVDADYIRVRINHPAEEKRLAQAGFQISRPAWGTFMAKPLTSDVTVEEMHHLFGVGTERFLISWLDVT